MIWTQPGREVEARLTPTTGGVAERM